jgi:hypothetical protein|tara:strand:+ start:134 stop:448 length:315 start_codon:yes stop_codon:yes gene_type:complete
MTNKDAKMFAQQIAQLEDTGQNIGSYSDDPGKRGPNDLEQRIEELMRISLSHQNLNADLRKEVMFYKKKCEHFEYMYNQLKKEKEDLHSKGQSMLNEFRNKGDV